jgi:hypothetical protein
MKNLFNGIFKKRVKCKSCGKLNPYDAKFCKYCTELLKDYDAFISYRRESGSELTSLIGEKLNRLYQKEVFIDVDELQVGRFDEKLLKVIEETPNFILILSPGSLDRCVNRGDWLKREIMHAIKTNRNIITVITERFTFPDDKVWRMLPAEMKLISGYNAVQWNHTYKDAAINRIESFTKVHIKSFRGNLNSKRNDINEEDYDNTEEKKIEVNSVKGLDKGSEPRFTERIVAEYRLIDDSLTGMTWLYSNMNAGNMKSSYSVALKKIESLNENYAAGYSNWRLPNLEEATQLILESPVERSLNYSHSVLYSDRIFHLLDRIWIDKSSCNDDSNSYVANFVLGKIDKVNLNTGRAYPLLLLDESNKTINETPSKKNETNKPDDNPIIEENRKPFLKSNDVNLSKKVREIIDEIDLKFTRSRVGLWGGGGTKVEDNNSELAFRDLRKLKRDTDIIKTLCSFIEVETENAVLIMKVLKILSYYRSPMCINSVQLLGDAVFKNKKETDLIHLECIKYFKSISTPSNRSEISKVYKSFALYCKSVIGRREAIIFLSKLSNKYDKEIIELLFELANDHESEIRYIAIKTLKEYKITDYSEGVSNLLQDPDSKVRTETISLISSTRYPLQIDFKIISSFLEIETDRKARLYACQVINKRYPEEEEGYFLKLLDMGMEEYVEGVLNVYRHKLGGDYLIDKIKELRIKQGFSENIEKLMNEFLQKRK